MSWAIPILFVALFLITAVLELRRADRRRLAYRLAASAVVAASLAILVRPPQVTRTLRGELALLVTDGAPASDIRRVADSARAARVLRPGDSLPDAWAMRHRYPGMRELVILGWGLDSTELPGLEGIHVEFHPASVPSGLVSLDWEPEIALGENVVVRGHANGVSRVTLHSSAREVDSATVDSAAEFTLRMRPRVPGLSRLAVAAAGLTDTLAVHVRREPPPRVLMLRSGPSFEASRLRDWLAARGGAVTMRTLVSAGRSRLEQVNLAPPAPASLSAELLDSFDVLIADARTLLRLSRAESAAVREALESGLGVVIEPGALAALRRILDSPLTSLKDSPAARSTRLRWSDGIISSPLPILAGALGAGVLDAPLAFDDDGRTVVQVSPIGGGSLVTTLVARPSRWLRDGEREAYDAYWAQVLSVARRPRPRWVLDGAAFARPHQPIGIRRGGEPLRHALVSAPSGTTDTVYLEPAGGDSAVVAGRYWPREPGVHVVVGPLDSLEFEVGAASRWRTVRAAANVAATRRWTVLQPTPAKGPPGIARAGTLEPGWFFIALLGSLSYLWWERRRP